MRLTQEQQQVAQCLDGTLLVLAAVGSGKTTTLSERVGFAISQGIEPARILALTFTNRAAQRCVKACRNTMSSQPDAFMSIPFMACVPGFCGPKHVL